MTRPVRWLRSWGESSTQSLAEMLAGLFVTLGMLRLPFSAPEAQVLVLMGLVWAVFALVRAGCERSVRPPFPLDVPCPWCEAVSGVMCHGGAGDPDAVHYSRVRASEELA